MNAKNAEELKTAQYAKAYVQEKAFDDIDDVMYDAYLAGYEKATEVLLRGKQLDQWLQILQKELAAKIDEIADLKTVMLGLNTGGLYWKDLANKRKELLKQVIHEVENTDCDGSDITVKLFNDIKQDIENGTNHRRQTSD